MRSHNDQILRRFSGFYNAPNGAILAAPLHAAMEFTMPATYFPFCASVTTLQMTLAAKGFPCGTPDGFFGLKTAAALDKALRAGLPLGPLVAAVQEDIKRIIPHQKDVPAFYGSFKWHDNPDPKRKGGIIVTDDKWLLNLVRVDLPLPGLVDRDPVHKRAAGIFYAALAEIVRYNEAHPEEAYWPKVFGTYCPRHKSWDPKQGLSMHSWAIAADIDPETNKTGAKKGSIPEWLFGVFRVWGFECGIDWSGKRKDGMHFQLAKV